MNQPWLFAFAAITRDDQHDVRRGRPCAGDEQDGGKEDEEFRAHGMVMARFGTSGVPLVRRWRTSTPSKRKILGACGCAVNRFLEYPAECGCACIFMPGTGLHPEPIAGRQDKVCLFRVFCWPISHSLRI